MTAAPRIPAPDSKLITGSEAVLRCLLHHGVDTIFGYPGGAIMPTYDALYDYRERVRHVLVRHEQGAAHGAQGYARVTGKAGVCLVTSGPGATNLVTGIADAMMDSTPLVCITGQVGRWFLGTDAFQETDIIGITMPITKWNYQITAAEEIPDVFAKAFAIAEGGRPGPVLIDITKNAQVEKFTFAPGCYKSRASRLPAPPSPETLSAAADLINESRKPLILAGHGILLSKAHEELRAFVEKSGIPVACTLQGLSCFPTRHPLYVGMLGMHGNYGPNVLTNEADLIIAVGMRFDDRVTGNLSKYATKAKVIHIDIDQAELNKNVKATVGICADAKRALHGLGSLVEAKERAAWLEEFRQCDQIEFEKVIRDELQPAQGKIKMSEVIHSLSELTKGEAITVTDVGQHQMVTARYYRYAKPDGWISSGGLGTMGFAIPAAMGAALAAGSRPVIAIAGDGGFQMTCQELGTIAQEKLPVKLIILNNNYLGMVRQWQELFFDGRYSFVHLQNPDFIKLADAFGIPGRKISEREDVQAALADMLAHEGPYLLEIEVEKHGNVFPMVPAGAGISDIRLE